MVCVQGAPSVNKRTLGSCKGRGSKRKKKGSYRVDVPFVAIALFFAMCIIILF